MISYALLYRIVQFHIPNKHTSGKQVNVVQEELLQLLGMSDAGVAHIC